MPSPLVPGILVPHPSPPRVGLGQVQPVIANRVTVTFENSGRRLIDSDVIDLIAIDDNNGAL